MPFVAGNLGRSAQLPYSVGPRLGEAAASDDPGHVPASSCIQYHPCASSTSTSTLHHSTTPTALLLNTSASYSTSPVYCQPQDYIFFSSDLIHTHIVPIAFAFAFRNNLVDNAAFALPPPSSLSPFIAPDCFTMDTFTDKRCEELADPEAANLGLSM